MVVRVVGFDPRSGPVRPSPTRSSPRALGAPAHPMRAPPPLDPFGSFDFSRAVTSLSLSPISLSRGALGIGDGDRRSWIPEVSSPPLSSPLSLPLPLPPLILLCARAPCSPHARPPTALACAPLRPRRRSPPLLPSPAAAWPRPCSLPVAAWPCPPLLIPPWRRGPHLLPPRGGVAPPAPAPSPVAAQPRPCSLPRGGAARPCFPPRRPWTRRRPPYARSRPLARSPWPLGAAPGPSARPLCVAPAPGGAARPSPLRAASAPLTRGVPTPSGAAPWPPRVRPLGPLRVAVPAPVRGPLPSTVWTRARLARPRRGLALPRLPQYVPACAAPHAR
jgi:hypothetical protein